MNTALVLCLVGHMWCNGISDFTKCAVNPAAAEGAIHLMDHNWLWDTDLIYLAAAESKFRVNALSPVGAYGVFQIMPIAESQVNQDNVLKLDRKNSLDNINIGMLYWGWLQDRYGDRITVKLAAWNWGSTRVDNLLRSGWDGVTVTPLPAETQQLIKRFWEYKGICPSN